MKKLNSVEELYALRDKVKSQIKIRVQGEQIETLTTVTVFMGNGGMESGAKSIYHYLFDLVEEKNIDSIVVLQGDVADIDGLLPIVKVTESGKESIYYTNVNDSIAEEIINKHA